MRLYRLDYYDLNGTFIGSMRSPNLERFERYKHKENYRIEIFYRGKLIYTER